MVWLLADSLPSPAPQSFRVLHKFPRDFGVRLADWRRNVKCCRVPAKSKQRKQKSDTLEPKPEEIDRLIVAWLAREEINTNQAHERLARKCGCSYRTIEDVRRYNKPVSAHVLYCIAEFFDVRITKIAEIPEGHVLTALPPVGRSAELKELRQIWDKREATVVLVSGMGGEGKTALAEHFREEICRREEVNDCRVDFYRKETAADCLAKLISLNDVNQVDGGEKMLPSRAAEFMLRGGNGRRNLLILEGFEELMTGVDERGRVIGDPLIRDFLHRLAQVQPAKSTGLVLVTSREPLDELARFKRAFREIELPPLPQKEGESLFRRLLDPGAGKSPRDVSDQAISDFVAAVRGHALTVTLAAAAVRETDAEVFSLDDATSAVKAGELSVPEGKLSAEGQHRLPGYVLRHAAKSLSPVERQFMQLVGCAVVAVTDSLLRDVFAAPTSGIAPNDVFPHALRSMGLAKLKRILIPALAKRRLLIRSEEGCSAHPLVKAFFSSDTSQLDQPTKHTLHALIFQHLRARVESETEITAGDIAPMAHGAYHACQCGQARLGFEGFGFARFNPRVVDAHPVVLAAPSSVLNALRPFFSDESWSRFAPQPAEEELTKHQQLQASLLAAHCWQQVGSYRSDFAQGCWQLCLNVLNQLDDPGSQVLKAYILFNLFWRAELFDGRLRDSLQHARQVSEVMRRPSPLLAEAAYILLAGSNFFLGRFKEAAAAVGRAELVAGHPEVRGSQLFQGDPNDPLAAVLCYKALCLWHQGKADAARRAMEQALKEAESVQRPLAPALTLFFAGVLDYLSGDMAALHGTAVRLREVSSRAGNTIWQVAGLMFACRADGGEDGLKELRHGIEEWQARKAKICLPLWHEMTADLCMSLGDNPGASAELHAALRVSIETGERWREVSLSIKQADWSLRAGASTRDLKAMLRAAKELALSQESPALLFQVEDCARRLNRPFRQSRGGKSRF